MNNVLAMFWKSILAGIGFAVGVLIVFLAVSKFLDVGGTTILQGHDLEENILPTVSATRTTDGHLVILGSLENSYQFTIENVSLSGSVFDGNQLIEQCVGNVQGQVKPKEKTQFVMNCMQKWKDINTLKLTIQVKPRMAFKSKGA